MNMPSSFNVPKTAKAIDRKSPDVVKIARKIFGSLAEYADTDSVVAIPSLSSYTSDLNLELRKWDIIPMMDGMVRRKIRINAAPPAASDVERFSSILLVR